MTSKNSYHLMLCTLLLCMSCTPSAKKADISEYNVLWESQSRNSRGSMPVGNGDIAANVWVDHTGELQFYISKTDAWNENGSLLKIGKLKIAFTPNLLASGDFKQELDLKSGTIKFTGKQANDTLSLDFWVDAHHPVIHIEGESSVPVQIEVIYDGWRLQNRALVGRERVAAYGIASKPDAIIVDKDTLFQRENSLLWCHHNVRSIWEETMRIQALDQLISAEKDPLLHLTFGALVKGDGLVSRSAKVLATAQATNKINLNVFALTEQASISDWEASINRLADVSEKTPLADRKTNHLDYWENFWADSYIIVHSAVDSQRVYNAGRGYNLQRYINACAGRGNMPIKFNGSIFNVDSVLSDAGYDADFRAWGGCYWWQNTRLPYWAMLYSGDFELMKPLFKMYMNALPLAKYRASKYYGCEGAQFPETIYFWGTWNNDNYGFDRKGKPDGFSDNRYIRYEWQGGIELIAMMLDYYDFTSDDAFLENTLLPFATEIVAFYHTRFQKGADGKILIEPAQALETYWDIVNPMPEVAGLRFILPKLAQLEQTDPDFRDLCTQLFAEIPDLPVGEKDGEEVLVPGLQLKERTNIENPELYAIFPYRHFEVGKPSLEIAQRTYANRLFKNPSGWQQNAIQAALLGDTEQAAALVLENFSNKNEDSRFPAFWGPNYDWVPDQDHGGVNMRALQNMLVQTEHDDIILFPAWPETWDVSFKIHAPQQTAIEGKLENGKLSYLKVSPESRKKDVRILNSAIIH
jgi:hypothetical protein